MNSKTQVALGKIIYRIVFPLRRAYRSNKTRAYGVVEHDNKILIVKNWLGSGSWSLPGGGAKKNETFEDTLSRELHEETGINIDKNKIKILIKGVHARDFGKKKYVIFHVPQNNEPKILINKLEIVDYKWVSKKSLSQVSPASYEIQQLAGLLK